MGMPSVSRARQFHGQREVVPGSQDRARTRKMAGVRGLGLGKKQVPHTRRERGHRQWDPSPPASPRCQAPVPCLLAAVRHEYRGAPCLLGMGASASAGRAEPLRGAGATTQTERDSATPSPCGRPGCGRTGRLWAHTRPHGFRGQACRRLCPESGRPTRALPGGR